ncbi:MAG: hypothetical protein JNL67_10380 [Planctomycetaceae bacterium]|nr:hypothetical protein [Planctomycetaceae bacterium]
MRNTKSDLCLHCLRLQSVLNTIQKAPLDETEQIQTLLPIRLSDERFLFRRQAATNGTTKSAISALANILISMTFASSA